MFVPKWDSTDEKPTIFPVRTTESRLIFERFSSRNGRAPLLHMSFDVFRVYYRLPA